MDISAFPGFGPFLDPVALAIVGGGTALAVVLRTPGRDLVRGLSALRVLGRKRFDADPLVAQVAAFGRIAKRHGVLALDKSVIEDPDMAAAVQLAVDGGEPADVEALVKHRIAARFERHRAGIEMWSGVADIAPAMGMIGTLIGLVQMFTSMKDPATIGSAMAIALLTTLYGAIVASLVGLPIATRLRRLARAEAQERTRLIAPLAALAVVEPAVPRQMREFAA
ncbi:MotA/TolQ/ExbB proton channel family protein [Sphingomonas sp. AOB5]|uniref:motility protein A n=1 Tax=Sphingomonas sp. AOB5 TaxID=3034017 RepID=UPI0023F8C6BC|nr:MotA/TolQ/ExbB proton channel family protein [Sphingomonas sp. AOB5]MDF7777530.1 MotA/TolQ/ExbB proton channel family protein [Sphingomonas sp. AOB5]